MVRLVPMTQAEFERYLEHAIEDYAQAHVKAGDGDLAEMLVASKADYDSLLPEGLASKNQHLFSVFAEQVPEPVGLVWFESRERRGKKSAYIYDIQVRPELRGKGYGSATLRAVDARLREMGIGRVSLNVMGWNTRARELYEREGYTVAGIGMHKLLA
jgi:ribosomal protein S18 acetylase RimI-like enzyme